MKEKIVLIGAGSAMFTCGLAADLINVGREADFALVDIHSEALETAERLVGKMMVAKRAPIRLTASTDRRTVLKGATAVICTIGVGGRRAWEKDVFVPRRHGLFAPVGDTVGPGGTSRALRMIPPMVTIAKDVLDLAPNALFFNYGNPMAPVCRAIRKATGANVVGLCHGVNDVAGYLAEVLNVPRSALQHTAVGINHLTWFIAVRANGEDMMPRLREIAARRLADFPHAEDSPFTSPFGDPFSWQLLQRFGAFPAVLDRHVTEFFPQFFREGRYYGRTLGVDAFSFEGTIAVGDRIYDQMRADALDPKPLAEDYFKRFSGEHEQVIEIIDSIRHERGRVYSANLPNTGQAPNLPPEAIVEGPAIANSQGVRAIPQPPLSPALVGTLASRYQWVETVVEAALEGSREKFIQALVLDGSPTSIEQAVLLADELLAAHREHLPWVNA